MLERIYNVPLRKEFLKVPRYKRAKKAVTALREFLVRHMKSDTIIIGKHLNDKIWSRGIKNPPHHVKLTAVKDDKGKVTAELAGIPKPEQKAATELKQQTEELKEKITEELGMGEQAKEKPAPPQKPARKKAAKTEEKPASQEPESN